MSGNIRIITKGSLKFMAFGLCLMAFFTMLWSVIAFRNLQSPKYESLLVVFPMISLFLSLNAVKFFRFSKSCPVIPLVGNDKKRRKWFGFICCAEGLGIQIAINALIRLGHRELIIPMVALVVGLHFIALGWLYRRSIDYYIAAYSTLVATLAILLSLSGTFNQSESSVFTGIGLALATSTYGFYMLRSVNIAVEAFKITSKDSELVSLDAG